MANFDPDAYLSGTEPEKKSKKTEQFDPDAYLKTPEPQPQPSAAQSFGRGAASLADSALNTVTGTLDYAAYPFALAYYGATGNRSLAEASRLAQQETTSPKDVVGRVFGVTGTPEYENAPLRAAGTAIGQGLTDYAIKPIAESTGLPEEYVGNIVNTGLMAAAPAATRGVQATGRGVARAANAVGDAVAAVPEFTRGAAGVMRGDVAPAGAPRYAGQYESARQPAGTMYHAPENIEAWRQGAITTDELIARQIPYTEKQQAALRATGGNVPYEGQVARAAGETFAEPYSTVRGWLPDVALAGAGALLGGPVGAAAAPILHAGYKASKVARAANQLTGLQTLENLGFKPLYPEELTAINKQQPHPSNLGVQPVAVTGAQPAPIAPQAPAAQTPVTQPTVQPVAPMLGYDPTVQQPRAFSERPVQPQPFYADQQGNVSTARPLAGSEAGYQERLTAADQIKQATDEALARQRQQVEADMAAQDANRLAAEQMRAEREQQIRQQVEQQRQTTEPVAPVAPTELPVVEQPVAKRGMTNEELRAIIESRKQKPTETPATETTPAAETPAVTGPVEPTPLESPFEWADKTKTEPSVDVASATKTQVRQDLKQTAKSFVTKENNQIKVDRQPFDEYASQFGREINWDGLEVKNSLPEAREQVWSYVYDTIKDAVTPEVRGERHATIVKRERAAMSPEELAAEDASARAEIERIAKLRKQFGKDSMGMIAGDETPRFANVDEVNQQVMMNTLGNREPVKGYIADRNAMVEIEPAKNRTLVVGEAPNGSMITIEQRPYGESIITGTNNPIKPTDTLTVYTVKNNGTTFTQHYINGELTYERFYNKTESGDWHKDSNADRVIPKDFKDMAGFKELGQGLIR